MTGPTKSIAPEQDWTYVDVPRWTQPAKWPAAAAISIWVHAQAGWASDQMALICVMIIGTFGYFAWSDWQYLRATHRSDAPTIKELR